MRKLLSIYLASFGAALVLAVLMILSSAGFLSQVPSWALLLGALILTTAFGVYASKLLVEDRLAIGREHSHRQLVDSQLEQQRTAIDIFADGLETAIFICESKGEIVFTNRKAAEMFHMGDLVGRTILAVTLSYDLQSFVLETFRSNEKREIELSFNYPFERVGLCEGWPDPLGDRIFLAIQDVTELRRLERVRRDFVANVSHELRTPLANIRSMAETMMDEKQNLAKLAQNYFPRVIGEVDRLSLLSADLLTLTSAESNPVRKHSCDIAAVYRDAVHQLIHKAQSKKLDLSYAGPDSLIVEANSAQMSQVAINLIDNAINYTNFGAISVRLLPVDHEVKIEVQDTGIGVASEHVPRIFERFYRADKARSRATGGTGLGLSIVKHIVEVHGGKVSVESSLNQGSTFTLLLPIGDINKDEKATVE